MRRGRKAESAASRRARQHFTETVLERKGCEIQAFIPHTCGGGCFDACHILPKSFIRTETNLWEESDHLAAMWDTDNALRGCRLGHNLFDAPGHGGVAHPDLPWVVHRFVQKHGWAWKLELIYPNHADRIAA